MKKLEFLLSGLGVGFDEQDKRTKKSTQFDHFRSKGDNEPKHFIIVTTIEQFGNWSRGHLYIT